MTLLGAGILWFGWFGFNAGSALAVSGVASKAINPVGANGFICGNINLIGIQLIAIVATIAYSAIMTFIILKVISKFMNLRVTHEEEKERYNYEICYLH